MRKIFTLAVVAAVALFAARSSHADLLLLTAGSSTFQFDSDGSHGGYQLSGAGFTNALESMHVAIRTSLGGNTATRELGGLLGVSSSTTTSSSSGSIEFTPYVIPGSSTIGSNILIPTLNFALSEDLSGNAVLDMSFSIRGFDVNSQNVGGENMLLDAFVVLDYAGVTPGNESAFVNVGGSTVINDPDSDAALATNAGSSPAVTVDSFANLNAVIGANGNFNGVINPGSSDLAAGLQYSSTIPVSAGTNFAETYSSSTSAIPEPNSAFGFGFLLTFVLGWLGYDARKRQVARR